MAKKSTSKSPVALALGVTLASTTVMMASASADANPFAMNELSSGYQVAMEGKCGGNMGAQKEAEGKCGGNMGAQKDAEGKCGGDMGAKKDAEGKCGGNMNSGEAKGKEGKCGEGKCGGSK